MSYRLSKTHPLQDFKRLRKYFGHTKTFKECCYYLGLINAYELYGVKKVIDATVPNEIIYTREGQLREGTVSYMQRTGATL